MPQKLLHARFTAHSLLNALTGLRPLIGRDDAAACRYIADLSRFLRIITDDEFPLGNPPRKELRIAAVFLAFHSHRCDVRPVVRLPPPPARARKFRLPCGTLVTLLENAIKHGAPDAEGRLAIAVSLTCEENTLTLIVSNPGRLPSGTALKTTGGLKDLRERLRRMHHEVGAFSLTQREDEVVASVRITRESPTDDA